MKYAYTPGEKENEAVRRISDPDLKYAYYPGCSLEAGAAEYDQSARTLLERLGAAFEEIPDWTCCGASAVESVSELLALALPARNLALAERELPGSEILVPCSACYLNLPRARMEILADKGTRKRVNEVLEAEELAYAGLARVRHLLDVLATDIGPERLSSLCGNPLAGVTAAPYYGCQALRPYPVFDDPVRPTSMEPLLGAAGVSVLDWDMGARCCGASLMVTHQEAALAASGAILKAAAGADCIVTVCPMCQLNLEAYQSKALAAVGGGEEVAVLYLPQLLGLAAGLSEKEVGLGKNLALTSRFRKALAHESEKEAPAHEEGGQAGESSQPPGEGG